MNKRKEILRSLKFVLFSASAGIIQVVGFTLMEEVLRFIVFGKSIDTAS